MARVSYIEENDHPELSAEIAKIKGGRGRLINVYRLLLHTPTVCMAWYEHIGAIRWKTKLPLACARSRSSASPRSSNTPMRCNSTCRASPFRMA